MSKVAESTTQSNVSDADSNINESPKTSLESNESHTDESHDQFKSPFESFTHHEQENTMQYLGNEVLNLVFNFKNVTEQDKTELIGLLNNFCNDKIFNEIISKLFIPSCNAYEFKTTIQSIANFPIISFKSAQNVLNDVFKSTKNSNIRHYILFLTLSLEQQFDQLSEKFKKLGIYNGLFYRFFIENCIDKVEKLCSASDTSNTIIPLADKYCLLSFVCQNDLSDATLPAKLKYFNIVLDYTKCSSFNELWTQLFNNYDALFPSKSQGFNLNGSFENSVKLFSYIAPVWDHLSATFALRNKPLPNIDSKIGGISGGAYVPDSDVVKIFAGDYSLIPSSEAYDSKVNIDVISTFNQLPNNRKLQVSHFLLSNRKRFNDILGEATQIVINGLSNKLDKSLFVGSLKSRQFAPIHARDVGFGNVRNELLDDSISFAEKLHDQYNKANVKTFDQAIGFITHTYIPMLSQFENRCNEKYGMSESRSLLSKFATDKVLNVIGVSTAFDTSNYGGIGLNTSSSSFSQLSGGKKRESPKIIEKRVEVPVVKEVVKEVPVYVNNYDDNNLINYNDNLNNSKYSGGSASSDLVSSLIDGQKRFNRAYEAIYRKLTSALNAVTISNVQAQTYTKLFAICNQFNSIAIKSNKTTSYISGYYGAKNYNSIYRQAVENTINAINESGVNGFSNVVQVLEELKTLLVNSAKEIQELRNKFISAPKDVSEMLIVASKNIKQPCNLTHQDFNALSEAIARIANSIKNYASETNIYNTKQQVEHYLEKVEDRTKVIKFPQSPTYSQLN